jgi:hypothetical protein
MAASRTLPRLHDPMQPSPDSNKAKFTQQNGLTLQLQSACASSPTMEAQGNGLSLKPDFRYPNPLAKFCLTLSFTILSINP